MQISPFSLFFLGGGNGDACKRELQFASGKPGVWSTKFHLEKWVPQVATPWLLHIYSMSHTSNKTARAWSRSYLEDDEEEVLLFALRRLYFLLQPFDLLLQLTVFILAVLLHVLFITTVFLLKTQRLIPLALDTVPSPHSYPLRDIMHKPFQCQTQTCTVQVSVRTGINVYLGLSFLFLHRIKLLLNPAMVSCSFPFCMCMT